MANPRRSTAISLAILLCATLALGGCGSAQSDGKHPDYERALAGSPPRLAALHRQANELLPGGREALDRRIAELRGYPVVVNFWASWCGPCRYEFDALQDLSARYGKRVAFLGVNSEDSDGHASRFLVEKPVPFPSYTDPDGDIKEEFEFTFGLPDTAYYDRAGRLCGVKLGQYRDHAALEADLKAFALDERCEGA